MVWDATKPEGTEQVRTGDDYIREFKQDVQGALQEEHIFPYNTGNPKAYHSFRYGAEEDKPVAGYAGRIFFNTDTGKIQYDDGDAWNDLTETRDIIPAGTVMAFIAVSAPSGWTKITTQNDKILRLVNSAGGGTGGTWTASFLSGGDHTHVVSSTQSLPHTVTTRKADSGGTGVPTTVNAHTFTHTHVLGTTGAHTHDCTLTWRPKYVDVILCSKD